MGPTKERKQHEAPSMAPLAMLSRALHNSSYISKAAAVLIKTSRAGVVYVAHLLQGWQHDLHKLEHMLLQCDCGVHQALLVLPHTGNHTILRAYVCVYVCVCVINRYIQIPVVD
jgi:hypothetical protein